MILFDYQNVKAIQKFIEKWGTVVLKPRLGGFGKGVTFINKYSDLRDFIDYIHSTIGINPDKGYLIERFYENDLKEWVSTTYINGELMYGYRKKPHKFVETVQGAFKVYDENEIGGEVDWCEVSELHKKEGDLAFKILKDEIIGFDMILHKGNPIIIDENTFPGYYPDCFRHDGKDPAEEFYKLIDFEISNFKR